MASEMFISDHVLLNIGFAAARARLGNLAGGGLLLGASEHAYAETITGLAGATGSVPTAPQLAGVCPGDLTDTPHTAQLPVHWEVTTRDGALFPALDADLTLTPAGDQTTIFALTGVFRPPPGLANTGLDQEIVSWFATAAVRVFLVRLAAALVHPSGAASEKPAWRRWSA
ncbi:MAG TPA: hypothetical protein VFJ07_09060 [Streptosporangiaceae bacterium]|nr:hypothetical protein [Streptosporangiaceae bacterium]